MSKEEIREGLITEILLRHPSMKRHEAEWEAKIYLTQLDSQGVVLKVDGELPVRFLVITRSLQEAYEQAERDMLKAGFCATERLI